jgi:hypothetical protein
MDHPVNNPERDLELQKQNIHRIPTVVIKKLYGFSEQ